MEKKKISSYRPDTNEKDTTLQIYNEDSSLGSLYHMDLPFQITLEYCSGITDLDYYNFLIASYAGSYSFSLPYQNCSYYYTNRPLHWHDFYELMIVLKGEVIQTIEDKDYSYPAGSCCFINRNLRHRENFTGETQLLFLNFSPELMQELLFQKNSLNTPSDYLDMDNPFFAFIHSDFQSKNQKSYLDLFPGYRNDASVLFLHHITDQILKEVLFPDFGSTYMMKGLICKLINYMSDPQYYHASSINLNSTADFLLFCRIGHLLEDAHGRISRHELASILNYTGDYIYRIVKKYSGLSLFDYSMTFCLEEACHMLTETNKSISFISEELGFTNRTHFYNLFKKNMVSHQRNTENCTSKTAAHTRTSSYGGSFYCSFIPYVLLHSCAPDFV